MHTHTHTHNNIQVTIIPACTRIVVVAVVVVFVVAVIVVAVICVVAVVVVAAAVIDACMLLLVVVVVVVVAVFVCACFFVGGDVVVVIVVVVGVIVVVIVVVVVVVVVVLVVRRPPTHPSPLQKQACIPSRKSSGNCLFQHSVKHVAGNNLRDGLAGRPPPAGHREVGVGTQEKACLQYGPEHSLLGFLRASDIDPTLQTHQQQSQVVEVGKSCLRGQSNSPPQHGAVRENYFGLE
jgi:hypothetical protein